MNDTPRAMQPTPASLDIKSANLPLVALMLRSTDLADIARELSRRFGDMPDFFDNEPLLIDLTLATVAARRQAEPEPQLDFAGLLALLSPYKLRAIAVRGASPEQTAAAQALGLLHAPDARVVAAGSPSPERPTDPGTQAAAAPTAQSSPAPATGPATGDASEPAETAPLGALLIDKPLRSGQQVYARGRDLVVLAMVNAGAEVIADGSIHVYAPLRGKAIAGARGNSQARIYAHSLEAELVSIAGIYRTSEVPLPEQVRGKAAMVRLVSNEGGDKLVMDALS